MSIFIDRNQMIDSHDDSHDDKQLETILENYVVDTQDIEEFRSIGLDFKTEMKVQFDASCKKLYMDLRAWLLKEKHDEQFETYYFPKNVWQCIVHDYAPAWYIKIFPVKYNELKVRVVGDVYVCPHHKIDFHDEPQRHVKFLHGPAKNNS